MDITARYEITPEVHQFLEAMGFGIRNISPDALRVILEYAIMGYLHNHKSADFPIDVGIALHNQTAIPLTHDMTTITGRLQKLKREKKSSEEIKILFTKFMHILEEEHKKERKNKAFHQMSMCSLMETDCTVCTNLSAF